MERCCSSIIKFQSCQLTSFVKNITNLITSYTKSKEESTSELLNINNLHGAIDTLSISNYNDSMANVLLRISDELYQEVKKIAVQEERSINKQLIYIIKKYVDKYKNEQQSLH